MEKNLIQEKVMNFSVRIVKLCDHIKIVKKYTHSLDQLYRSGTSIGANYNEAQSAVSKKDFYNKAMIALKEARETTYWLELLFKTEYLSEKEYISIQADCEELLRLLISVTKKVKEDI